VKWYPSVLVGEIALCTWVRGEGHPVVEDHVDEEDLAERHDRDGRQRTLESKNFEIDIVRLGSTLNMQT
jgi:hypothetical protein